MKDAPPTYRIRDWQKHFENHESRKVKSLAWVPVKNKHDGAGYRRVAALPNSVQVFCGWCLIVQVASRMPTRGVLCDEDGALDPADLASKTGFPESVFKAAFDALIHPKIRWLELVLPGDSPGNDPDSGRCRGDPGDSGVEGKGTEGNRTEENEDALVPEVLPKGCARRKPESWPRTEAEARSMVDGTGVSPDLAATYWKHYDGMEYWPQSGFAKVMKAKQGFKDQDAKDKAALDDLRQSKTASRNSHRIPTGI